MTAPPILVTGAHRSGTTWVGRMLCASREAGYIHEPFNPNRTPGWIARKLPYWFLYVCDDNESEYGPLMEPVASLTYPALASLRRTRSAGNLAMQLAEMARSLVSLASARRPLLKDPFAIFSAEWLARRFDMSVVMMIRHPAGFVSSIKRLHWGFDYERNWLSQDLLMRDLLGDFAGQFRGYRGEVDVIGEGIVMWNAFYHVVTDYRRRHPDWLFIRAEDLAEDPLEGFRKMYAATGLTWGERPRQMVARASSSGNPREVSTRRRRAIKRDSAGAARSWKSRLTASQIDRIRSETAPISGHFYEESDWR